MAFNSQVLKQRLNRISFDLVCRVVHQSSGGVYLFIGRVCFIFLFQE